MEKVEKSKKDQIKLTISDRMIIGSILPKEGDIKTNLIIKEIINKISLTENEIKKFNIKDMEKDGKFYTTYDQSAKDYKKEIDFSLLEKNEIKLCFEKLSKEKKLPLEATDLSIIFEVKE